jgi:hypothetical protein
VSFPDAIELTFPEHWPAQLRARSRLSHSVPLERCDLEAMAYPHNSLRTRLGLGGSARFTDKTRAAITDALHDIGPDGAFLRTSYGAVKESPFGLAPVHNEADATSLLRFPDTRIGRFVQNRLESGSPAMLHLGPWQTIPSAWEFRTFVKARRIVGVSQLYVGKVFPDMLWEEARLRTALQGALPELVRELHLENVVLDLHVQLDAPHGSKVALVELNPFAPRTDPCLYTWQHGGDFDHGLRLRRS